VVRLAGKNGPENSMADEPEILPKPVPGSAGLAAIRTAGAEEGPPYDNLYPDERPSPIHRYELILEGEKWITLNASRCVKRSATGAYAFVKMNGRFYVARDRHLPSGHIDIARGAMVEWAGRIFFSNRHRRGILRRWDNASGNYRPSARYAGGVGLPMNCFSAYNE
jgi:hypothetical protein